MCRNLLIKASLAILVLVSVASVASADVKLPGVFADHMVLQRDAAIPVWGWAEPGEKVTVTLGTQSKSTTACKVGKWQVKLDPVKAGGPYVLKVEGNNKLQCGDVLVGEVWLCSGQSNMGMTVSGVRDHDAEIAAAKYPKIRLCGVARKPAQQPQTDAAVQWHECSPATVGGFSATAYFFGRELHKTLDVPVGLINSSWGGTPIQAWTSVEAQQAVPALAPILEAQQRAVAAYDPAAAQKRYEKQLATWKNVKGEKKAGKARRAPQPPQDPRLSQHAPATLYNGMIAPLAPFAIRGAIWYQGEANANGAKLYGTQLKTMLANWRQDWGQGDFPFLYVQLPNFMAAQQKPSETGGWPLIREQFLQSLTLPNTGMAVTIDVGEANNIHPKDKQEVGRRLAQWALAKTYAKDVCACGPLYKSMTRQGNKIVLHFDYAGGGLAAQGGQPLKGFAIAGADKQFVWADAKIEGDTVVVWSPKVASPKSVRYAWANNPACNLANKAGLPASPFRTDDWAE